MKHATARPSSDSVLRRAVIETLEERRLLAAPNLDPIAPVTTLPVGKTIQIPLTATDAEGNRVDYTATSDSGSVVPFVRPRDGTFIRMEVRDFGSMEFQLFNANAPDAVRRILGLVNSNFYDGLTFHRVVDNFVIQGGDPAGDGTNDLPGDGKGDPRFGGDDRGGLPDSPEFQFDDEFNPSNIYSQPGVLGLANAGKDTNGSQFFVTTRPVRELDFNQDAIGQLVRGFDVLTRINGVAADGNDRPIDEVVIDSISVVENQFDGVLQLRAAGSGNATVTVTATDSTGQSSNRTIAVSPQADTFNDGPILGRIDNVSTVKNGSVSIPLTSTDLEGDPVVYTVDVIDPSSDRNNPTPAPSLGTAVVGANAVTFTPARGYDGPVDLIIGVRQDPEVPRGSARSAFDTQRIRVAVGDEPIALSGVNIDAARNVPIVGAVVATITDQDLGSNETAFVADVDWGDGVVSRGADEGVVVVATGEPGVYNVLASHTYEGFVANLPTTVTVNGNKGVQATAVARAEVRPLATLDARTRILFVSGTDGRDDFGAVGNAETNTLRVNMGGAIEEFPLNLVERMEVQLYGGDDVLRLGGGVPNTYAFGDDGNDVMVGGPGRDTMSGGSGKNFLYGMGGDDRLQGSNGRDYLDGGEGVDRLYGDLDRDRDTGRGGNDTIFGGGGADNIFAGAGDDYIDGGTSNDPIRADFGNDTIFGGRGRDIQDGGPGRNLVLRSGLDDPDELADDSDLLINITIVDELDRIEPFFL